jgi:hypothetical protein
MWSGETDGVGVGRLESPFMGNWQCEKDWLE